MEFQSRREKLLENNWMHRFSSPFRAALGKMIIVYHYLLPFINLERKKY